MRMPCDNLIEADRLLAKVADMGDECSHLPLAKALTERAKAHALLAMAPQRTAQAAADLVATRNEVERMERNGYVKVQDVETRPTTGGAL